MGTVLESSNSLRALASSASLVIRWNNMSVIVQVICYRCRCQSAMFTPQLLSLQVSHTNVFGSCEHGNAYVDITWKDYDATVAMKCVFVADGRACVNINRIQVFEMKSKHCSGYHDIAAT